MSEGGTVQFLFTSGYSRRDVSDGSRFAPNVRLLHKSWTLRELLIQVRQVLDRRAEHAAPTSRA